jgi:Tfp pilus assembly protein PilZ
MLQFALCVFFTLRASDSSNDTGVVLQLRDEDLVTAVENTLEVCLGIARHMDRFSAKFDRGARRRMDGRDKLLVDGVGRKLDTCSSIYDAVKSDRGKYCSGFDLDKDDQEDEIAITQLITFNVGGNRFSTNLTTLRSVNGTFFERMFRGGRGGWNITSSADGTYFIDRSPRAFEYIMDYLRNGDLFVRSDAEVRIQLLDDAKYYHLPQEVIDYLRWKPISGINLWFSEVRYLNQQLKLVGRKMGTVLYEAAQDGDSSSIFHSLCDDQGPTVVIIMTNTGNVFGGYSSIAWSSSGGWGSSSTAFLFRLRPSIKRYNIKSKSHSIYRHSGYGPTFGGGHDIYVRNSARRSNKNNVGHHGYDGSSYSINSGNNYFKVQDYAVVQAISL